MIIMIKNITQKLLIILFLTVIINVACQKKSQFQKLDIVDVILTDTNSYFYLNAQHQQEYTKDLPIGIFDSGTGGLTVLDAIVNFDMYNNSNHQYNKTGDGIRDFQSEYFIYLGDQANMPYGNYSQENNVELLKEHIIKDAHFLMSNKYYLSKDDQNFQTNKKPVKIIVIACNTATAYGKAEIEAFLNRAELDLKVIGVIDAGVKGAMSVLSKSENGSIGVMATAGTIASQGYAKAIQSQIEYQNYHGKIGIFQQAGIGLAGAIDGSAEHISNTAKHPRKEYKGPSLNNSNAKIDMTILARYGFEWEDQKMLFDGEINAPHNIQINSINNYISYHLTSLLEKLLQSEQAKPLKAIILGCTHYPFYLEVFTGKLNELYDYTQNGKYIYRKFMAQNIELIDPALNTANEIYEYLNTQQLFNNENLSQSEFYISLPNNFNKNVQLDSQMNFTYEYKYSRSAGFIQQYVKRVPFSKASISSEIAHRLEKKIPLIFDLIRNFNQNNSKMNAIREDEKF